MQIPLRCYLIEFKFRFVYFLLSFFLSLLVVINYHEAVFFFETYTFLFINEGAFIATHIAELFSTSMYISFNLVLCINYPFAYYHCSRFFNSSWYKSQVWFFKNMQSLTFITFLASLLLCYFLILPYTYAFLDTWTVTIVYAFKVQLEARIATYVCWTLQTMCLLSPGVRPSGRLCWRRRRGRQRQAPPLGAASRRQSSGAPARRRRLPGWFHTGGRK